MPQQVDIGTLIQQTFNLVSTSGLLLLIATTLINRRKNRLQQKHEENKDEREQKSQTFEQELAARQYMDKLKDSLLDDLRENLELAKRERDEARKDRDDTRSMLRDANIDGLRSDFSALERKSADQQGQIEEQSRTIITLGIDLNQWKRRYDDLYREHIMLNTYVSAVLAWLEEHQIQIPIPVPAPIKRVDKEAL